MKFIKSVAIYGGADFVSKIIAFLTFPVLAKALNPAAFGLLELAFTLVSIFGLFVGCGINGAAQRYYWEGDTSPERQRDVISTGLYIQVGLGLCFLLLYLFGYYLAVEQFGLVSPLGVWGGLACVLLILTGQWVQYLQDTTRLHFSPWSFFSVALTSKGLTSILGVCAVLYFGAGVPGLLIAQVCSMVLVMPLGLYLVRRDVGLVFDKQLAVEMLRFGYPFIFVGLAYWVFGAIDRWMLTLMSSVEDTGIFSVASRFASILLFVSMAFGQAWSPFALKLKHDKPEGYREVYYLVLNALILCMGFLAFALSVFSKEIVQLTVGDTYVGAVLPFVILVFGVALQAATQVTAIGISLERKTHLFARLSWAAVALCAGLNYFLIPLWGGVGAAWSTFVVYLFLSSSYLYFTQRLHPLPIVWPRLIVAVICFMMMFAVSLLLYLNFAAWQYLVVKFLLVFGFLAFIIVVSPVKRYLHAFK